MWLRPLLLSRLSMPPNLRRRLALLTIPIAAAGCGDANRDGGSRPPDSAGSTAMAAPRSESATRPAADSGAPVATSGDTTVAGLALWDVASLEKRLDLQGMAPRKQPAPVRHPFLSVPGAAYLVGNAELQVFIYESQAALERDVAQLDTVAVAPRGKKGKWPTRATFIRNSNLAAILLGQNGLQIERVQRALMAGRGPG